MKNTIYTIAWGILAMMPHSFQLAGQDSVVSFVAYWEMEERLEFEIAKIGHKLKDGEIVKSDSTIYTMYLDIIASTDTTYTLRCSYNNEYLNTYDMPIEVRQALVPYEKLFFEYQTNQLGEYIGLTKWDELAEAMTVTFDALLETQWVDDEEGQKLMEKFFYQFKDIYSSKQGIEEKVLEEIKLIHMPMGYEYQAYDTLYYEDALTNLFGGPPLRADAYLYIDSINTELGFCHFVNNQIINGEDAKQMVTSFMTQLLTNENIDAALNEYTADIRDTKSFAYFYNPGWPWEIVTQRITNFGSPLESSGRLEITKIRLINWE